MVTFRTFFEELKLRASFWNFNFVHLVNFEIIDLEWPQMTLKWPKTIPSSRNISEILLTNSKSNKAKLNLKAKFFYFLNFYVSLWIYSINIWKKFLDFLIMSLCRLIKLMKLSLPKFFKFSQVINFSKSLSIKWIRNVSSWNFFVWKGTLGYFWASRHPTVKITFLGEASFRIGFLKNFFFKMPISQKADFLHVLEKRRKNYQNYHRVFFAEIFQEFQNILGTDFLLSV